MNFQKHWENAIITKIAIALYVSSDNNQSVHINRAYHGFVLNDSGATRDYCFSDGRVMHTEGGDIFYLPKGSTYYVKDAGSSAGQSCYAINFDADIECEPFTVGFRNNEPLVKMFKEADVLYKSGAPFCEATIRATLYEIIVLLGKEFERKYAPKKYDRILDPAIERITASFTDNSFDVSSLAKMSGVSEAYFRRLFVNKYGMSPKEYIINLRINYAKSLLLAGEFAVSKVALMCGYSDPAYFSREFSHRVGVAPKDYKKKEGSI